jgi:hypothetical protein
MNETDNFNLAGYLRKNTLMESFEGFGGYRDLHPLKEDDNPKPKSTYVTDDSEDDKGFIVPGDDEVLSQEWEERFLGLGGYEVVKGIKYLVDDGFELDDIIKFLKNNEL